MTTPERLRRRQRRESIGIALLALGLFLAFIYFRGVDDANDECFSSFVETQTETSSVRAEIVERESRATRHVIRRALRAETRPELRGAFRDYRNELKAIDQQREDNPVQMFPADLCN